MNQVVTFKKNENSAPCVWTLRDLHDLTHKSEFKQYFPRGSKTPITVADTEGNHHFLRFTFVGGKGIGNADAVVLMIDWNDDSESTKPRGDYKQYTVDKLCGVAMLDYNLFPLRLDTPIVVGDVEFNHRYTKLMVQTDEAKGKPAICLTVELYSED